MVEHPISGKPFIKDPTRLPEALVYIYNEMKKNSSGYIDQAISISNTIARNGLNNFRVSWLLIAYGIWGSQVMDARIKNCTGSLGQYLGNWDHKPFINLMSSSYYRKDVWSNIHYGYVGSAAGFTRTELTGGAGIEQLASNKLTHSPSVYTPGAENSLAGWDDPYDTTAIQLGIDAWSQYGSSLHLVDFYILVLSTPGLALAIQ